MAIADIAIHEAVEYAIAQLAVAKDLETEARSIKASASKLLIDYMTDKNLKRVDSTTTNAVVTYVAPTTTERFNKQRAIAGLLSRGVNAVVIQESWESAKEKSERAGYVQLKISKPKG